MRKLIVTAVAALALIIGVAAPAGSTGYIWGGGGTLGVSIAGGSYDTTDNPLTQIQSWAVTGYQEALYSQGWLSYADWVSENGYYGNKTKVAVQFFQQNFLNTQPDSLTPSGLANNGRIGPNTAKALLQPYVLFNEGGYGIPAHRLHGLIMIESQYDAGAHNSGGDRGLVEWSPGHTEISNFEPYAEAIDNVNRAGKGIHDVYVSITNRDYGGGQTGADLIPFNLRWNMASASWNAYVGAFQWADCYAFTQDAFQDCGHSEVAVARYYGGVDGNAGAQFPD